MCAPGLKRFANAATTGFLIAILGLVSAGARAAETLVVDSNPSSMLMLKKIDEKVGNLLKATVVDRDGREQRIYIAENDAFEIKRGLWVIRPGIYRLEI